MSSIVEVVQQHAQRQPEQAAILFEDQVITYGDLAAAVIRFARATVAAGLQRGERVALFLENCPELVIAYLGTHLAGGVAVPVNPQYRQIELQHILADAGVRLCMTDATGADELRWVVAPTVTSVVIAGTGDPGASPPEDGAARVAFAEFLARGDLPRAEPLLPPAADTPAVIAYTSGTTGRAKGALLLHRNQIANITAVTTAWRWTDRDRLLLTLPLFHTHGLMVGLHGTLYMGASAVLHRRFQASDVLAALLRDPAISLFFGVPTMYARLLAEAAEQPLLPRPLRLFVSGSAPLSPQLFAEFERVFGQRILERYGMTETIMNLTNPYEGERRPGAVGGPFPGEEVRVVEVGSRRPLPAGEVGEVGEIEVRGPHVFAGYWNRPDATAEAFSADGWFKTGDLGWRSADGYYTITGRARELIISGGYNVYPREVEDVLAAHPAVAEAAVLGVPDADLGEQVVAVIIRKPDQTPEADEIIAFCRDRLASYKKPRRVMFVDALPRNALGKVQKHLLAEQV